MDKGVGAVLGQLLNTYIRAISIQLDVEERAELRQRLEVLEQLQEASKNNRYGA